MVGQEHITETLKNQVRTDRLSHAYLFIGTRGTGKTTCAKILAKAVNCESPVNGNPCNRCAACRGIDDGTVMDVVEMDAASNNKVEDVRLLRDEAVYSPANVKKRVYIVDEVHMLSNSAFNALLKILEEPPEHLMFILATTELHKVPATILSRCQRHSFKRIAPEQIAARLQYVAGQEQIPLEEDAARLLARLADGGMRDALTLLDQCSGAERVTTREVLSAMGMAGQMQTVELLKDVVRGDTAGALRRFRALWQDGKDPATMLDELAALQRDALMRAVAPEGSSALLSGAYDERTLDAFVKAMGAARLLANLNLLQEVRAAMGQSVNTRLSAELCLIRLSTPELQTDLPSLAARITALESGAPRAAAPAEIPAMPETPKSEPMPEPKREPEPEERPPFEETPPWEEPAPPAPEPRRPEPIPEERPPFEAPPPWDEPPPPEPENRRPEPEPEPAAPPPPPSAGAAPEGGADWASICQAVQPLVNPGQFSMLRNATMARGRLEGGTLTVELERSLAYMLLNTPEIADKLRRAAESVAGGTIAVRLLPMEPQETGERRSLEELARFENVEFQ